MNSSRHLIVGVTLLLVGVTGLMITAGPCSSVGSMMRTQLPPGIERAKLPEPQSDGAKLFVGYCTQCHDLPDPGQHTGDEWPVVVQRMVQNMTLMNRSVPDRETVESIQRFLQKHARQ